MIAFQVEDMTSVQGVNAITRAVRKLDKRARIEVDLDARRVAIEVAGAGISELGHAIRGAGYTPVQTQPGRDRLVVVAASEQGSLWWG